MIHVESNQADVLDDNDEDVQAALKASYLLIRAGWEILIFQ